MTAKPGYTEDQYALIKALNDFLDGLGMLQLPRKDALAAATDLKRLIDVLGFLTTERYEQDREDDRHGR